MKIISIIKEFDSNMKILSDDQTKYSLQSLTLDTEISRENSGHARIGLSFKNFRSYYMSSYVDKSGRIASELDSDSLSIDSESDSNSLEIQPIKRKFSSQRSKKVEVNVQVY